LYSVVARLYAYDTPMLVAVIREHGFGGDPLRLGESEHGGDRRIERTKFQSGALQRGRALEQRRTAKVSAA